MDKAERNKKSVVYRLEETQHAVWQPDADIELYIPVVLYHLPLEILTIPVYHATAATLKEAWAWQHSKLAEVVQNEHKQIDDKNAATLALLSERAGGIKRMVLPLVLPGNKRRKND